VGKTILCNGFDVSGDGSCPREPGACADDEEMHLGVCYKKCKDLTKGAFPHRFAAATCCKVKGLGCLNIRNDMTSGALDRGDADEAAPVPTAGEVDTTRAEAASTTAKPMKVAAEQLPAPAALSPATFEEQPARAPTFDGAAPKEMMPKSAEQQLERIQPMSARIREAREEAHDLAAQVTTSADFTSADVSNKLRKRLL